MLLEDYTELSNYIEALISSEMDAPGEEDMDMNGHFTWAMIGELLDTIGKDTTEAAPADPGSLPSGPAPGSVSSVDALLCITNCAESSLRQGKVNEPAIAEMVADMMRDTADKIEKDPSLNISAKERNLMVLWLQRYANKLVDTGATTSGLKSSQGLWNNIQYKVRQFYEILT